MIVHNRRDIFSEKSSFDKIFEKACHHSYRVYWLRIFVPSFTLIVTLFFCWFMFFSVPTTPDYLVMNDEESLATKLTMIGPRLESYTSLYKPYWLEAERAFRDHAGSGVVELQNIMAKMPSGQKGEIVISAQRGIYNDIEDRLRLDKPFDITTEDGTVAQFMAADVNLSESQFTTSQRVDIRRTGLSLTANALKVHGKERNLYFQGEVHLVLNRL